MPVSGNPGDIQISAIINNVNVTPQLRNVAVFEDIKKPYTIVQALLYDSVDLLNRIPIQQNAQLSLAFGQAPDQPLYSGTWILTTVKVHRSSENYRATYWSLQGYSPHMLAIPRVQQSFQSVPMSSVVQTLITQLPGLIKPFIVRAPSMNMAGNQHAPYVINNQQTFSAARTAMLGSASAVDASSAYTLYENQQALVLDTLEHALVNPMSFGGNFFQAQLGTDFYNDPAILSHTILSYSMDDRLDTTALIQAGAQQVSTFDLFSQNFTSALSSIGSFVSAIGSGNASGASQIIYNMLRPPTYAQNYASQRATVAAQFDSSSVTVEVPLNTGVTVGSQVKFNIVGALGDLQVPSSPNTDYLSQFPCLAAEVRHGLSVNLGQKIAGSTTIKGVPQTVLSAT